MQGAHGGTRVMASDAADPSLFILTKVDSCEIIPSFKSTKVDSHEIIPREMQGILTSFKSTKVDSCYTRSSQTVCKPEKAKVT